jgi:hypothetical protein
VGEESSAKSTNYVAAEKQEKLQSLNHGEKSVKHLPKFNKLIVHLSHFADDDLYVFREE